MHNDTSSALSSTTLGSTGLKVSTVGFGGIPIIRLDVNEAEQVVRHAYEQGINLFDTANAYKDSEYKIGRALQRVRDKVVLATKSFKRDGNEVVEQMENSLRQLRTDYIDLYQLHQISQEEEWQEINRLGGVMDKLSKELDKGKICYLGFSSHSLDMAVKLVQKGVFSTVQFPFNFIEQESQDKLFPVAKDYNMGILTMKPFAGGVIDDGILAFSFLRQYPNIIPLPGFDSISSVDEIISFYAEPNVLNKEKQNRMEKYRQELGRRFCRRCEYCQPCPNGVMITMAMGYPLVVSRMSPQKAVEFARQAMETVQLCEKCGECEKKCPYKLPIMEMLQENYKLFKKHEAQYHA